MAGLLLAGCAVDQADEVATYRKVLDIAATTRPATRPADQPLGLVEAMLLANQENERLGQEGESYLQAIINRKRALALFLPTADLAGTYTFSGDDIGSSGDQAFDLAAIGRINVFNGFRDRARLRVADLTIEQRRLLLLNAQESLLADVVRAFHNVLRLEQEVKVLETSLALQEQRVLDARARNEAGSARMLDVSQTEAQAAGTRVRLLNTRTAAKDTRAALAVVTGLPRAEMPLVDAGLGEAAIPTLEEAQGQAMADRSDVAAAGRFSEASRQEVEAAVGRYYPSLAVNLKYFFEHQSNATGPDWDAALEANVPIFSAGLIRADVRTAWSSYRQAALFESLLRRQVMADVEIAVRANVTSRQRITELDTQVRAAQQALDQAEASFDAGLATNLERLVAQDQYLNSKLQLTSEIYNQRVYAADLARATSGLRPLLVEALSKGRRDARPAVAAPATAPSTTHISN